jgi:DNA-directed RNA polymerase specialized sigma24 family protein
MLDPDASTTPRAHFATTCWSVVLAAGARPGGDAHVAMETLCAAYWLPLYAFIRRRGYAADAAEDLTQAFFTRLLEHGVLGGVDQSKGRFRAFLLATCKDFLANRRDYESAKKRGGGRRFVPIDAESRFGQELAHELTPDAIFDKEWALALLDRVLQLLAAEMIRSDRGPLFDRLKPALLGESQALSYGEVAIDLGMTEGAVRVAAHRLRRRYRLLLRDEIAQTVADPAEVDDEIRDLFHVLKS